MLVLVAAMAYLYFFSAARTAPKPLSLATPAPSASPASATAASPVSSPGPGTELLGPYTIGQGSLAGYRVKEQFGGQPSPHEAVSRTTSVTGGLTVAGASGQLQATGLKFTVQLADLASVDQVAGFNVTQRDRLVRSALGVSQFAVASFEAAAVQLPAAVGGGNPVTVTVPGQLTIHGVVKAVEVAAQVQVAGGKVTVTGSVPVKMSDYGISPPQAPFVAPESQATIEFQLVLSRS